MAAKQKFLCINIGVYQPLEYNNTPGNVCFENYNTTRNSHSSSLASPFRVRTLEHSNNGRHLAHSAGVQSLPFNLPDNIQIRFKFDSNWERVLVIGEIRVFSETAKYNK